MSMTRIRTTGLLALGLLVLGTGCATRGQLERGLQEQRDALAAERQERMSADQRLAGELRGEMQTLARNVEALRTDLATLDNEFGARLTSLEDGLQLAVPVHFAFDQAEVREDAAPLLDRFVEIVQRNYADAAITVEGFTDPAGSAAYNRRLAQRRAEAVRQELIRRGLPETQLRAVGYGADRPVIPGAAGRAHGAELNRRVVFVIETPSQAMMNISPIDD
jgi:outer membrane protein OmpA-like peptidoglycan-associated protein